MTKKAKHIFAQNVVNILTLQIKGEIMPREDFTKAIEIYEDLNTAVAKSDSILKLAMKYVPLSTKDGIELHRRYDELVRLLIDITNKKY